MPAYLPPFSLIVASSFKILISSRLCRFTYFKVVRVMCRCDLYTACSEFLIYIFICDDRNLSVCQRQASASYRRYPYNAHPSDLLQLPYHPAVFPVWWLRSLQTSFFSNDRIIDMPEMSFLFFMLYLCVRNGCLTYRTPVDDPGTFVDISLFIEINKYFLNCF